MKKDKYTIALTNWLALNASINSFSLNELETLLDFEVNGLNRKTFITRIHQRIVRQRGYEERKILVGGN